MPPSNIDAGHISPRSSIFPSNTAVSATSPRGDSRATKWRITGKLGILSIDRELPEPV